LPFYKKKSNTHKLKKNMIEERTERTDEQAAEELCKALMQDDFERALQLAREGAAPIRTLGRGSSLFLAIDNRQKELIQLLLSHPRVGEVINGTSDTWDCLSLTVALGMVDVAKQIMATRIFISITYRGSSKIT
jgi:hypothetical protein